MNGYWFGKTRSEETKKKISEKLKGVTWKPERLCPVCGKDGVRKGRKYCSKKCYSVTLKGQPSHNKGKKFPFKQRPELKGKKPWNYGKPNINGRGENCHLWKGGTTKESAKIRTSIEYKNWRREVFKRDDYTCQECNERGGYKIAHHIKDFALFPELRFEISNGITLCKECHKKTDNYPKNLR